MCHLNRAKDSKFDRSLLEDVLEILTIGIVFRMSPKYIEHVITFVIVQHNYISIISCGVMLVQKAILFGVFGQTYIVFMTGIQRKEHTVLDKLFMCK